MAKDVDPKEWLVCRIQEMGNRYLLLIYEYISLYPVHDEDEEEWERLAFEVDSTLKWIDKLTEKER